jgi:hypothetical protein
LFDIYEEDI